MLTAAVRRVIPRFTPASASSSLLGAATSTTARMSATSTQHGPADEADARALWRRASVVCFDVDSTVSTEEGIDVLAATAGKGDAVAEWTRKAMGGDVLFQDAISARLDIIKPSRAMIAALCDSHSFPLTPGMPELFNELREQKKHIYLVSGGLFQMIEPIADSVGVAHDNVFAIRVLFDETTSDGDYAGFDRDAFTARTGGKERVMSHLKEVHGENAVLAMVGDGVTDLEAGVVADVVVGFGQNVVREPVKAGVKWFAMSAQELIDEVKRTD